MIRFRSTARVAFALAVICCLPIGAALSYTGEGYNFDDLYGPSGISYQWMIINDNGETFGDSHTNTMDVSGDLLTTGDPVLNVTSGKSSNTITDRSLNTMFLVAAGDHAEFTMNFRAPDLSQQFNVATPNLGLSTNVAEGDSYYTDTKSALGQPSGYDSLWRGYNFQIDRLTSSGTYDTVLQYFNFQQNPANSPSLGIPVPFVVANVVYGTASDVPLDLRLTLRDSNNTMGNIAAYDMISWSVEDNYPPNQQDAYLNDGQWVFVPVANLNTDNARIEYLLTTEVANHTAVRYAAYDGSSGGNTWAYPSFWKFDLVREQGMTDIWRQFQLGPDSHIAPGLVTVYSRPYNVNESNKRPLRLFAFDDARATGVYDLRLNHRIIFGRKLGDTYRLRSSEGNFSLFEVTAFQPRPASMNFYDSVARITGSNGTVEVPSTASLTASSVKHDAMPSEALQYFTIDHNIPSNLRNYTREGMLPLHVTFNIPITQIQSRTGWNNIIEEWRRSGNIADIFADYFNIYLLPNATTEDGQPNTWNMTQELQNKGVYSSQVKVFIDEDRGRVTADNDRGLITVSFIVMLMNGTRDQVRPMLTMVPDNSTEQENNYIFIRDGNPDNKWNMTFFIAPANYIINDEPNNNNPMPQEVVESSGGGGGCNAGMLGILGAVIVSVLIKREGR